MSKPFKTHIQQVNILRRKGMTVPQNIGVKLLEKENYYNVINGYKDLFIDIRKTSTTTEQYKKGTNILELFSLYKFDCDLKSIFLKRLLRVENEIKSLIAYRFSEQYTENTNKCISLENFNLNPLGRETREERFSGVINLIASIQQTISSNIRKHSSIRHYMNEHGYVPLWVLMEVFTFGKVSLFYKYMKQKDKQKISAVYNVSDIDLETILKNLGLVRNLCAHDERLYNFKAKKPIRKTSIHTQLSIPCSNGGQPLLGVQDLFSILISLKLLLPQEEIILIIDELTNIICKLSSDLKTISINDVLSKMGFPQNWDTI